MSNHFWSTNHMFKQKNYFFCPGSQKKKSKGEQTLETLMFVIGARDTHYFGLKQIVKYNRTEFNSADFFN